MTEIISHALAQIINLKNAADCHKKDCHNSECSVSLFQLKVAATYFLKDVYTEESIEANALLHRWPL